MAINFPDNRDQLVPPQPSGPIQTGDVYVYLGTTYTATVLGDGSVRWDAAVSAGSDAYVLKVGDTMTGQLTLPGGGTGSEAATVDQITSAIPAALWQRDANTSTLSPVTADDNINQGAGDISGGNIQASGFTNALGGSYSRTGDTNNKLFIGQQTDFTEVFSVSNTGNVVAAGDVQTTSLNSAGLGRSLLINGGFAIWQRGTNGGGVGYQTADRWRLGSNAPNLQRVFPPDSDGIPCGVAGRLTGAAGGALIRQAIELPEPGRRAPFVEGTQWTLSWYSTNAAQTAADAAMRFSDDSAGTNQTDFTESNFRTIQTLASGWTRYSVTYTAPAGFTGSNACVYIQIAGPADGSAVDLTGIQLEPGPVASPYTARPVSQELAMCQRYYQIGRVVWNCVGGGTFTWTSLLPNVMRISTATVQTSSTSGRSILQSRLLQGFGRYPLTLQLTADSGSADVQCATDFSIDAEL